MDENERQRKARERAARKAEIAEAMAATEELTRKERAASERALTEAYHKDPLDLGRLGVLPILLGIALLLIVERQVIEHRVSDCFNAKGGHNYGCAQTLAHSMWTWLLPRDMAEELKAAQEFRE